MTTVLNHPSISPPTEAPSAPLPVSTLPNGSMEVSAAPSAAAPGPGATGAEPGFLSSISNEMIFYSLVGVGIIVIAGLLWYYRAHEEGYPSGGLPPGHL